MQKTTLFENHLGVAHLFKFIVEDPKNKKLPDTLRTSIKALGDDYLQETYTTVAAKSMK